MVRDDARWQSIAQGIARFKPTRRLNLDDTIIDPTKHFMPQVANEHESSASTQYISISSDLQSASFQDNLPSVIEGPELFREDSHEQSTRKRKVQASIGADLDPSKRTKRTSFARTKQGLNPAFKNPIAGCSKVDKDIGETPRPRTAPEPTILVPFTKSPKIRRAFSGSIFSNLSQERVSFSDSNVVDETSLFNDTESPEVSQTLEVRPFALPENSSANNSFEKHKYPANQEQLQQVAQHEYKSTQEKNLIEGLSQTSLDENELEMGTRKLDTQNSPSGTDRTQSSDSDASTETPSDPYRYITNSSPLAQRSTVIPTPVIDLITQIEEPVQEVTKRDVLGPVSSPVPVVDLSSDRATGIALTKERFKAILALPLNIKCETTNTIMGSTFASSIPGYMLDLAEQCDLVNQFRPVDAPAMIRNVERGYWKLLIEIADLIAVTKSRRSPLTSSQWSDKRFMLIQEGQVAGSASTPKADAALRKVVYPYVNPGSYTPWTLDEFVEFWNYLAKVIERGRAGYDVRAGIKSCEETREGGLLLEVRLWGWGAALSHLWLILYGVSSGLTTRMPLQWFGPGIGALITMSGQPERGGAIGRWVEKRPGAEGYWGHEEAWEGLETSSSHHQ